jgi:hypothetical protein
MKGLFCLGIPGNCAKKKGGEMAVFVEIRVVLQTLISKVLMVSNTGKLNGSCQDLNQTYQYHMNIFGKCCL